MKAILQKFVMYAGMVTLAVFLSSCSSGKSVESEIQDNGKILSFYNFEDGYRSRFDVNFDGDRITSIFKDGRKLPSSEIKKYEDLVYKNLDEMNGKRSVERDIVLRNFDSDRDNYDDAIKNFREDMPDKKKFRIFKHDDSFSKDSIFSFDFKEFDKDFPGKKKFRIFKHHNDFFADSSFREGMKKMKDELAKLKDKKIRIYIDSDKIRKDVKKMQKEMKEEYDLQELNEKIREMTEELKEIEIDDIDVDIPEIEIEIENLDDNLSDLDEEMSDVKVDLKNLNNFTEEIKKELYKDGIIKSESEGFSFNVKSGKIMVNDKEIPSELTGKYKNIYKKHFGKELKDTQRIEIEEGD